MPTFEVKRTNELSQPEADEVCSLFNKVFNKDRTLHDFYSRFSNAGAQGAWHVLVRDNNKQLCAENTFIPYRYCYNGKNFNLVIGVDSAVLKNSGMGPFCLFDMHEQCKSSLVENNIKMFVGFPNENAFSYQTSVIGSIHLGDLDFYVLPLKFSWLSTELGLLNPFAWLIRAGIRVLSWFSTRKPFHFLIQKVDDENFRKQRYLPGIHHRIQFDEGEVFYSLYQEEKMMVAYILDIAPLSPRNFYKAFLHVANAVKGKADVVAYPGIFPAGFHSPLRVPKKFLPRKLHMVAHPLTDMENDDWQDIRNWNINLSNFDVR